MSAWFRGPYKKSRWDSFKDDQVIQKKIERKGDTFPPEMPKKNPSSEVTRGSIQNH